MSKHPECAINLDDADLDRANGGVPLLLPAVQSAPEKIVSTRTQKFMPGNAPAEHALATLADDKTGG